MSTDEFSGVAFAVGTVRGTRAFAIDKLGRLTGVVYKQVWRPGENDAECRKNDFSGWVTVGVLPTFNGGGVITQGMLPVGAPPPIPASTVDGVDKSMERRREEEEERRKRDSLVDCQHGFYGYYDGSNDYYKPGMVMGVVEGYGETVIGTRGFRCMKARIVALRIPKHVPAHVRALVTRNYEGIPFFDTFKEMVAQYPPDDAGSGYSPDAPDFWTRRA